MVFSCSHGTPLSFRYSSGGAKAFKPGDPTFPAAAGMCSVLICLGPTHKSSRPSIEGFIYDCAACYLKKGLLALLAEVFSTENPRLLCLVSLRVLVKFMTCFMGMIPTVDFFLSYIVCIKTCFH